MLNLWVKWYGWEINFPKSIIGSSFAATWWFSALFILEIPLVPIILRSSMRQVKRDWGLGHCAVTHYPMYQYLVGHIFIFIFFGFSMWHLELRTADILLLFFGPGRVILCTSFIDFSFFVLWILWSCLSLYFMCHYFMGRARYLFRCTASFGGEESLCSCLSAGFVFRDVARGSEPMIRFLTMVSACISHCRDTLHSTFMEQILSNVQAVGDISK